MRLSERNLQGSKDSAIDENVWSAVPLLPVALCGAKCRRQSHTVTTASFMLLHWNRRLNFDNVDKQFVFLAHPIRE